jgi:hypothetical protein
MKVNEATPVTTDLRTIVTIVSCAVVITSAVVGNAFLTCAKFDQFTVKLDSYHADCERISKENFDKSFQVRDYVETVHQWKDSHGVLPDASEVLRISRANERE